MYHYIVSHLKTGYIIISSCATQHTLIFVDIEELVVSGVRYLTTLNVP